MNWKAHGNRLIVEPLEEDSRIVLLTDPAPQRRFRVLSAGPKCREVKDGDIVSLPGLAATEPDHRIGNAIFVTEGDVGWKERA